MLRTDAATAPAGPDSLPPSLPALPRTERGWTWWVGTIITLAVLVAAMLQLAQLDLARVAAIVPSSPAFWLVFALSYFAGPLGDYAIFRRLWQIPVAGFFALLRKRDAKMWARALRPFRRHVVSLARRAITLPHRHVNGRRDSRFDTRGLHSRQHAGDPMVRHRH